MRRALIGVLFAWVALLCCAPGTFAHAQLDSTIPARGAVLPVQPAHVVFAFSESVEGTFGAIRVFDAEAERVDDDTVDHPDGEGSRLQVGLKPGLPDGTYTATYRIISADGHPVTGGLVFSIGEPGAGPSRTVEELIGASDAGTLTRAGARTTQALQYLATALAVGLLAFFALCWRPGIARAQTLMLGAVSLAIAASVLRIVLEGAIASGSTFWDALDPTVVRDVLQTHFGAVWGLRTVAWVLLGAALLAGAPRRRGAWPALAMPAALIVIAPALEGHSATLGPTWLLIGLDVLHVLAMTVWLGGLAALALLVPRVTRELQPQDRSRLLAALLARFSPVALAAVLTLLITGSVTAIEYLTRFSQLWDTGYGREILIKIALLGGLVVLGAVNRRRVVPRLRTLAAEGGAPGAAGRLLRTTLRLEIVLVIVVLGVSALLVDGVAPVSSASGPVNVSRALGPLDLELTVDPARAGGNEIHLYLFRSKDGAPFTQTRQLTVTASLPSHQIGPLPVTVRRSGPGHFTADTVQLVPRGAWRFSVTDRVSDFDQYQTQFSVPIR